jgi:hypothetical protein
MAEAGCRKARAVRHRLRGAWTWAAVLGDGILAKVPGEFVSAGSKGMPEPASATESTMGADVDANWAGRVRITYRR